MDNLVKVGRIGGEWEERHTQAGIAITQAIAVLSLVIVSGAKEPYTNEHCIESAIRIAKEEMKRAGVLLEGLLDQSTYLQPKLSAHAGTLPAAGANRTETVHNQLVYVEDRLVKQATALESIEATLAGKIHHSLLMNLRAAREAVQRESEELSWICEHIDGIKKG